MPTSNGARFPHLPQLEVLILNSGHVVDAHLPAIGQVPKLRVLSVPLSSITDNGLKNVVEANPNLEYLSLYFARGITKKSIRELAKLRQLKYLHIGRTTLEGQLGAENAAARLQWRLPNCFIGIGELRSQ